MTRMIGMKKIMLIIFLIIFSAAVHAGGIDSYTKFMLHADGDNSSSAHTYTANGDPQLVSEGKFNGSIWLDSTGDCLAFPDSSDWDFGSDDFTIDFWAKTSSTADMHFVGTGNPQPGETWYVKHNSGAGQGWCLGGVDSGEWQTGISTSDDQWHHIAFVSSGTTLTLYVDGVSRNSRSMTGMVNSGALLTIGRSDGGYYVNGNIDEFRISKGIARWTSNFTPETAPYSSDSYTKLLLHLEGDESDSPHNITFHGEIDANSTEGRFEGGYHFDGNGDYITVPSHSDFALPDDFAIDFWTRLSSLSNAQLMGIYPESPFPGLALRYNGGTFDIIKHWNATIYSCPYTLSTDTWYHIAITRSGTTLRLFVNGTLVCSNISTEDWSEGTLNIGFNGWEGDGFTDGMIDEFRLSKGVARYTANFTPGTEPYSEGPAGQPIYTEFNGIDTTDFSSMEEFTNVTNVTLEVENTGKISYPESYSINASFADLDAHIQIDDKMIYVNASALDSTFNSTVTLTFENVNCAAPYVYYSATAYDRLSILAENDLCLAPRCTNIQCADNTLTVDVIGFSGYAVEGYANLTIDADDPKNTSVEVHFTAEYLNVSNGQLITGANCTIYFTDDTQAMSEGASEYTYNRTFSSSGNKDYNVTCSADGYNTLTAYDTANITSPPVVFIPEFSMMTLGIALIAVLLGLIMVRRRF